MRGHVCPAFHSVWMLGIQTPRATLPWYCTPTYVLQLFHSLLWAFLPVFLLFAFINSGGFYRNGLSHLQCTDKPVRRTLYFCFGSPFWELPLCLWCPALPTPHTSLEPIVWRPQLFLISSQSSISQVSCCSDPSGPALSFSVHLCHAYLPARRVC